MDKHYLCQVGQLGPGFYLLSAVKALTSAPTWRMYVAHWFSFFQNGLRVQILVLHQAGADWYGQEKNGQKKAPNMGALD